MTFYEARNVVMIYGKFKDKKLCEIPAHYLKWLSKNWGDERIRHGAELVIEGRNIDLGGPRTAYKPVYRPRQLPKAMIEPKAFIDPLHSLPDGLF